jgi:uncharacterized protein (TIGR00299 family) protein
LSGKVLYLDVFAGVAGDMFVAALLHLGADLDLVRAELAKVRVRGYRVRREAVSRGAFAATRFVVEPDGRSLSEAPTADEAEHGHDHGHGHGHGHGHDHGHGHGHDDGEAPLDPTGGFVGQPPRTWRQIRALIGESALAPRVKERAIAAFGLLAEAEGRVHGMPAEAVTFHEVGAVDSIVDILAAVIALELLEVDRIVASSLPMGSGVIRTAHGLIPIPAPATVEVLLGWPVRPGKAGMEQVTPTGATLIAALAEPGPMPAMTVRGVGYGAGTKDPPDMANVLRAILGEERPPSSALSVEVLEAQMDDLSGEHLPALLEALLAAGALDAIAIPVLMKKGRPGQLVVALAEPHAARAVERAMLRHGSSFGLRSHPASRRVLDRRFERVETPWGPVRVKVGHQDGEIVHAAPEHADVAALARETGLPEPRVYAEAQAAWYRGQRADRSEP